MEALKWIGYTVAAIAVLSVAIGFGIFLAAVLAVGGALVFVIGLVLLTAGLIKSLVSPR